MKHLTLALTALAAFTLTAGVAAADMQPIPNPPERHVTHHMVHHVVHHHVVHHVKHK